MDAVRITSAISARMRLGALRVGGRYMTQLNTVDAPAIIDPGFRRNSHRRAALLNVAVQAGHLRRANTSAQIDQHTVNLSNLIERSLDNHTNSRRVETTREYLLYTLNKCPPTQRGNHLETAALALLVGDKGAHEIVAPAGILYETTALWPSLSKSQSGLALVYANSGDPKLALQRAALAQNHALDGWKLNAAEVASLLHFDRGDFQGVIKAVQQAVRRRIQVPAKSDQRTILARLYLVRCYAEIRLGMPTDAFHTLAALYSNMTVTDPTLRRIRAIYAETLRSFLDQGAKQSPAFASTRVQLMETGSMGPGAAPLPDIEAIYKGNDPRDPSNIFEDPFQSVQAHDVAVNVLHQGDAVLTVGTTQYEFSLPTHRRRAVTPDSQESSPVRAVRRNRRGRWPSPRDLLPMAARILARLRQYAPAWARPVEGT